ncbi:MAG: hypothetical protein KDC44_22165 [Phaeodactylibacter sp.]|nr:hypothetical protein [Phaeodactylibacter sp.]
MTKKIRLSVAVVLALAFSASFSACYYDIEEELYPETDCVTDNVNYSTVIQPILQTNCYTCHSAAANQGGITLEGHGQLLQYVNSGQLLGAIRHDAGFSPMPQGAPQLVDCDIEQIAAWIDQGAPNN